jgi:hypothetical protein
MPNNFSDPASIFLTRGEWLQFEDAPGFAVGSLQATALTLINSPTQDNTWFWEGLDSVNLDPSGANQALYISPGDQWTNFPGHNTSNIPFYFGFALQDNGSATNAGLVHYHNGSALGYDIRVDGSNQIVVQLNSTNYVFSGAAIVQGEKYWVSIFYRTSPGPDIKVRLWRESTQSFVYEETKSAVTMDSPPSRTFRIGQGIGNIFPTVNIDSFTMTSGANGDYPVSESDDNDIRNNKLGVQPVIDVATTFEALTLTEFNADVKINVSVQANVEALSLTEFNAGINDETIISTTIEALTLAEFNADILAGPNVNTTLEQLTLVEYNASIEAVTLDTYLFRTLDIVAENREITVITENRGLTL